MSPDWYESPRSPPNLSEAKQITPGRAVKPQEKMDQDHRNDVEAEAANDEFKQAIRAGLVERELGNADRAEIERGPSHDEASQQRQHSFELPRSFREHAAKLGQVAGSDDEKFGSFHFDYEGVIARFRADAARQKRTTA